MSFDRKASTILFLFSCWATYLSINIPRTAIQQRVGPEVMPLAVSLALMLAAVVLYVQAARAEAAKAAVAPSDEGAEQEDRIAQGLVILGLGAYVLLLIPLGFIIATALFCIYQTSILEPKRWVRNVATGVVFSVCVYGLFVNLLEVLLPVGILGW